MQSFLSSRDKSHVEWVTSFITLLVELQAFVKQYHTTGLTWNPKGDVATKVAASLTSGSVAPSAGPPPPPAAPSGNNIIFT
jgi:adenylyl cyclase-associated protein